MKVGENSFREALCILEEEHMGEMKDESPLSLVGQRPGRPWNNCVLNTYCVQHL